MAVFRPSTDQWFVDGPNGPKLFGTFGGKGDVPVPGDYDGVGYTEPAVYRPSTGQWFVNGPNGGHVLGVLGGPNDLPVPGDYGGVGHTEMAVFRPLTAQWFVYGPSGGYKLTTFGGTNDLDVPAAGPGASMVVDHVSAVAGFAPIPVVLPSLIPAGDNPPAPSAATSKSSETKSDRQVRKSSVKTWERRHFVLHRESSTVRIARDQKRFSDKK